MRVATLIVFVFACLLNPVAEAKTDAEDRPNVVFILIDDLSHFTMTSYGATAITSLQDHFKDVPLAMPNIDKLAQTGLMCEQAYVYPICEPTRVAILSGMHNGRNFIAPKAIHESQITISDVFKRAGYATGMFGKWKQTRGTKDVSAADYIHRFGWDDYLCFDVANNAPGWSRFLDPTLYKNGELLHFTRNDKDPVTGRRVYGPDVCNRAALDFIDRNKDNPFFLYYPMILVHDEHTPTPDTRPKSVYDNFDIKGDFPHGAMKGDARQYFPDMLAYMDKLIGKVVDKLDEHGLRENTLIVLMGDNGTKAVFSATQPDGSQLAGGKGHSRFIGEQVGLLFNQPGTVPAGKPGETRTFAGLVDATDLYPTFLEACGIDVPNPDRIDGISVWPQVLGRANGPQRQAIFKWYNANRRITDLDKKIEFAQTADFKRYAPHHDFPRGRFFDLRDNPWEHQGKKGPKIGWQNFFYHGLNVRRLTPEQQAAYDMLGEVLDEKAYVAVDRLEIQAKSTTVTVDSTITLSCDVIPTNATRNNVIWESSDPKTASIDKFGVVTGHRPGKATITVYSWDDANPVSNPHMPEYRRDGIKDTIQIDVRRDSVATGLPAPLSAVLSATYAAITAAPAEGLIDNAGPQRRPNLVFILIDDLSSFTMTAYGAQRLTSRGGHFKNVRLKMPHMDDLARTGLRCEQAYVYPICEPTRVAILSGMHNGRNFIAPKALHESQITFTDVFQRAGYATGMFGKWKQTRGTREARGMHYLARHGWDDYLCYDVINEAKGDPNRHIDPKLYHNGKVLEYGPQDRDPQTGRRWFGPDICNRAALDFIDRNRNKPFLLYYPMLLVHDEHTPTPDTRPKSAYDNFDTNAKYNGHLLGDDLKYFPDMLAYTDKLIGKIVAKLDEHNLREDTLIVLMGDNGTKVIFEAAMSDGRKLHGGKGHNRFNGEHVGLIFNQPGTVPAGQSARLPRTFAGLVDAVDLYPTFLEAAGLDVPNPDRIDGISVWPQVTGRDNHAERQAIYKWYNANRLIDDDELRLEFAQTADFKRYAPHKGFPRGRFFDLRQDPYERVGEKGWKWKWLDWYYHGLDLDQLTAEQQAAYDMLGEVLEENTYRRVRALRIQAPSKKLTMGSTLPLTCDVIPANATRNNIIWESSDPAIASIDKFGVVTGHKPGKVRISVYSWDDAKPVANLAEVEYRRNGVRDHLNLEVTREGLAAATLK